MDTKERNSQKGTKGNEVTPPAYLLRHTDLSRKKAPRSKARSQELREKQLQTEHDDADRLIDYMVSGDLYQRDHCPRPEIVDSIKIYYHYLDQLDAEDYGIFLEPFITVACSIDGTYTYSAETYDTKLCEGKTKEEAIEVAKNHRTQT